MICEWRSYWRMIRRNNKEHWIVISPQGYRCVELDITSIPPTIIMLFRMLRQLLHDPMKSVDVYVARLQVSHGYSQVLLVVRDWLAGTFGCVDNLSEEPVRP